MIEITSMERLCASCDRNFTGKAGRMLGDRPLCQTCANRLRDPVVCAACGRPTRRPGRAAGQIGLVCEPCHRSDTHSTCRFCRRHRRIAAVDGDRHAICTGCIGEVPVTHQCPVCDTPAPGGGASPCRHCEINRRVADRIALNAELLDRPWLRELFLEFCAWLGLRQPTPATPGRIGGYGRCFAAIGEGCADPMEISQERLLALLGAEGLRRNHLIVRFLTQRLLLQWTPEQTDAFVEARRVEAILAASDRRPWGAGLRVYRDHLVLDGRLRPKTIRFYLTAAAGLLAHAGHADLTQLKQDEVDGYLRRRGGQRASLARFLSHVACITGTQLALPAKKQQTDTKAREKTLLGIVRSLLDQLDKTENTAESRALLAAALSNIYAIPLSQVLAMRASDVVVEGMTLTLWPDTLALPLSSPLVDTFRKCVSLSGGYVFPGKNGVQPLSTGAIRYHTHKILNTTRV